MRARSPSATSKRAVGQPLPDVMPDGWDLDWVDLVDAVANAGFAGLLVPADPRRRLVKSGGVHRGPLRHTWDARRAWLHLG